MRKASASGTESLARRYRVSPESIEELVEIVCILHDAGKLGYEWQRRAWLWQNDKDARMRAAGHPVPPRPKVALAHTWFDTLTDREIQRQPQYSLPHHAVEGAYSVADSLFCLVRQNSDVDWGEIAAACACTSIARHHGPRSAEFHPFHLSPLAQETVSDCLPLRGRQLALKNCTLEVDAACFSDELLTFAREQDELAWPLYVFLVRRLRLADQASLRSRADQHQT
jgi:CRISPR-associated endonuclease/helicase Cas3